uniref:Endonuclease n=1 Tax=Megaselia scalaris TaxID=36166 RepID=T1GZV5_MEGSC
LQSCYILYVFCGATAVRNSATRAATELFDTLSNSSHVSLNSSRVTNIPHRFVDILKKFQLPEIESVRYYSDYILYYDTRNKIAFWVYEHLTADSVRNSHVNRRYSEFLPEEDIHPFFRSNNGDYYRSGYDRGHLAAAANHKLEQQHCNETFRLCNISPQVGVGFNRDAWNNLEIHVRKLTNSYTHVYCFTGPLFLPRREDGKMYVKYEVIGNNNVSVPTHFFKIALLERSDGKYDVESYVLPNENIDNNVPLNNFFEEPETIEKAAGFLFFDNVPKAEVIKINGRKV